jgi:hypothetical protein
MDYPAPFPQINSACQLSFRERMAKKNTPTGWKTKMKAEAAGVEKFQIKRTDLIV